MFRVSCIRFQFDRVGKGGLVFDGVFDFVEDFGRVSFALRGSFEGEVYFVGIILLLIGFACQDRVEVPHEWDGSVVFHSVCLE